MYLWDDSPLNNREFSEWLDELDEFNVKSGPNVSKAYYTIILDDAVILFEKDDWDRAQKRRAEIQNEQSNLQRSISLDWNL